MARNYAAERMLKDRTNNPIPQNQPTSTESSEDEMYTHDKPLDNLSTPRPATYFIKSPSAVHPQKSSTLTQMLHSEDNESLDDERPSFQSSRRGTASTWSNPSLTSDGLTSADSRANTPSPPPPATIVIPPVVFGTKPPQRPAVVIKDHSDSIEPLQRSQTPDTTATAFEAGLGRKRCVAFACGRKDTSRAKPEAAQTAVPKIEEPPKRKCMLTFVCPNKIPSDEAPTRCRKPSIGRKPSPAPVALRTTASPPKLRRSQTSSSQLATQKTQHTASTASRPRRLSNAGEGDTINTERACEFVGTHNEDDDWMKERTCHRNRLTVNDTLKVELGLQKIGLEAAEEEESEDEAELDNEGLDDDDEDEDEAADADADDLAELNADADDESDAGFDSDDEGGMADSDEEESDTDSDYHWWAPGRSTAATSYEQLDHMHFTRQRNMSGSSIGSLSSSKAISGDDPKSETYRPKKGRSIPIRTRESDLPDSTDFVCGTLDEDRPMEESFRREIEMRRAAKHRACPQDIDPTFPTSDPEMDEDEDDNDVFAKRNEDESDGVFGHFEQDDVKGHLDSRGRIRRGRSPVGSPPKRLRSPPPKRPTVHRSPPPRRLFGQSPKRLHSPPPYARLRSPPPTRRASFAKSPRGKRGLLPSNTLAERPQQYPYSASLPRQPNLLHAHYAISTIPDADDSGEETQRGNLPTRGAIDIVKGLEKKRQFRKDKLYQKYCRQRANGTVKPKEDKRCAPGKGAEKMREKGLELAGRWNGEKKYTYGGMTDSHDAQHILSL